MVLSKKKVHRLCHVALLSKFFLGNLIDCPSFQTSVNRDFTANEYLAEPFDYLWPTLFTCVQNITSFFMVETAQSVVVTAQRGLRNCAAAHARSLEGTLFIRQKVFPYHLHFRDTQLKQSTLDQLVFLISNFLLSFDCKSTFFVVLRIVIRSASKAL